MSTKRKFIESHWLTFAVKGAVSVVAGLCMTVTTNQNMDNLVVVTGWTMIALALIEIYNVVHRAKRQHNWGFPLFLGLIELIIAVAMLSTTMFAGFNTTDIAIMRVSMLAGYVLFASVVTIMMGFTSFDNRTDRFMWIVNGIIGAILAFLMFNSPSMTDHIEIFGIYLLVNGLTDLFFGVHSKDEALEAKAIAAEKRAAKKGVKK